MSDKLIFKKMSSVLKDFCAVGKDSENTLQRYKFRSIDAMINALHPLLAKNEIFIAPKVVSFNTELREVTRSNGKAGIDRFTTLLVEYSFYTTDGSSITVGPIASEGLDSGDKATNKALSAAMKYALIQTFAVATEDIAEADLESPVYEAKKTEEKSFADQFTAEEKRSLLLSHCELKDPSNTTKTQWVKSANDSNLTDAINKLKEKGELK